MITSDKKNGKTIFEGLSITKRDMERIKRETTKPTVKDFSKLRDKKSAV